MSCFNPEMVTVRRTTNAPVHVELMSECFIGLELSVYERLIWEYTEEILDKPSLAGNSVFADLSKCSSSTWKWEALTEKYSTNFAVRYWVAVTFAFCHYMFVDKYVMSVTVICTFLLSTRVAPFMRGSLDGMLGATSEFLTGAVTFDLSCAHRGQYGKYVLTAAAFCFWMVTLYAWSSGLTMRAHPSQV